MANDELEGNTLTVYAYIVHAAKPVGTRDVTRGASLSSTSVAFRHLQKLEDMGLIEKNSYGDYILKDENKHQRARLGRQKPRASLDVLFLLFSRSFRRRDNDNNVDVPNKRNCNSSQLPLFNRHDWGSDGSISDRGSFTLQKTQPEPHMTQVRQMGKEEILAAIELALSTQTQYGLSVEYDAEGNPVIKLAPSVKAKSGGT